MEASRDGRLVRQYHAGFSIRISSTEGVKYCVQRLGQQNQRTIRCDSVFVSRKHCEIFRKDKAYWIKDLGSSNGTFLNGTKLTEHKDRELRFGDIIGMGISHIPDDEAIPVNDSRCFIFNFKMEDSECETEIVELDVDEDVPAVNQGKQKEKERVAEESDEDIEIVGEIANPSSASTGSSAVSTPRKKPMPPPPPPPIISKPAALKSPIPNSNSSNKHSSTSTSENGESSRSSTPIVRDDQRPSTSKSLDITATKSSRDTNNKRPLPLEHPQPPVKRSKPDKKVPSSSSDDSSDGLGDVEKVESSAKESHKGNKRCIISSGEDNSSDDEKKEEVSNAQPNWIKISTEKKEPEVRKSKPGPARFKFQNSARNHVEKHNKTNEANEDQIIRRRKYDALKAIALRDTCRVKLQQIILCTNGKYTLTKAIFDALIPSTRTRMQVQFRHSLNRNAQRSNLSNSVGGNAHDSKKEKEPYSPYSDSENEDDSESSTNKYKRVCNRENVPDRVSSPEQNANDEQEFHDVEEHNNDISHEPDVARFPETTEPQKPKTPQRGIQLLADAPLPRFAARAQSKYAPYKQPAPNSGSKFQKVSSHTNGSPVTPPQGQSFSYLSREEQKQMRTQKLKEMELKRQQSKEENAGPTSPKRTPQPTKIKYTARNRNQGLMESIMDSKSKSNIDPDPLTDKSGVERNDELPHKNNDQLPEFPSRDPRLTSRSRVIPHDPRLKKDVPEAIVLPSTKSSNQEPRPSSSHHQFPGSSRAHPPGMIKPGAHAILSPPTMVAPIVYKEKVKSSVAPLHGKPTVSHPAVHEDDLYKRVLGWVPAWLEEQKNVKGDPPILKDNESLTTTLIRYESYDAHFKIYYPLLLSEVWACISSDNGNKFKTTDTTYRNLNKRTEYKIKIDEVKREPSCVLVKRKLHGERSPDEEQWVNLTYHTWVAKVGDIDYRKDLVILTIEGTDKDSGKPVVKIIFGFPWSDSERYDAIKKPEDCDSKLLKDRGLNGYRFTETIVCKFGNNIEIDKSKLGLVRRISNFTPQHRVFRALNNLQSYALSDKILSPREDPKQSWQAWLNQNATSRSHEMISVCKQLNLEQQAVVRCVTHKVGSEEPMLMLMHGPPGTGKTTTIVALVLQLIVTYQKKAPSRNHRILICTPSNAAIDEIIRRLEQAIDNLPKTSQNGKKISMIRVGEGFAPELKKYSVDAKVEEKEREKSQANSIKAEITDVENEIEELAKNIDDLKKEPHSNPIALEAKLSSLKELHALKRSLKKDYDNVLRKVKPTKSELQQKRSAVIAETQIICSTLSASSTSIMKKFVNDLPQGEKSFLCCIVDEASQTTEPETLLPLVLNIDKLLLVGDPYQLGATVLSNSAEEKKYGQSLFSRHFQFHSKRNKSHSPIMTLTRQYRMHDDIVNWPNAYFYDSRLKSTYSAPPSRKNYPLRPYYFLNLSAGREHSEREGQIKNTDEVILVKALVDTLDELLQPSGYKWTIGIITPYAAQKQGIRKEFEEKTFKGFEKIEIDTVDGFQGQERDIIIISCVRTDGTGFLKSPNRLNVALTRAKHSLFVVGDTRNLSQHDMWRCLIQDAAKKSNKFDVNPGFAADLKLLKTQLFNNLKKSDKTAQ